MWKTFYINTIFYTNTIEKMKKNLCRKIQH